MLGFEKLYIKYPISSTLITDCPIGPNSETTKQTDMNLGFFSKNLNLFQCLSFAPTTTLIETKSKFS